MPQVLKILGYEGFTSKSVSLILRKKNLTLLLLVLGTRKKKRRWAGQEWDCV